VYYSHDKLCGISDWRQPYLPPDRKGVGHKLNYFEPHYSDLRWPLAGGRNQGLRLPQWGDLHAIAAHFSNNSEPAIITMPTGSGKTAVLMSSAFVLRSRRALVITPSRIVREQIADEFRILRVLRTLGVVDPGLPTPSVYPVVGTVQTARDWAELSHHDVIVSLPNSISPGIAGVSGPPADFFDLVLIDEAHHGPARTWRALLDRLQSAKQVHFTATPFRRDRRELSGKLAYIYQLRDAYRDGVFGQLDYQAVSPAGGEDPDRAIALAASNRLRADRLQGLEHRLMVRTGAKIRAHELHALYTEEYGMRMNVVTGDQSVRRLRRTVEQLVSGDLDGIVCVDMLGEGFDLPNLKVAALHSPHKSLAVTLQLIGRFARTTAPNLGTATFFALASDMEIEKVKLYREGAVWEEIIPNLSGRCVQEEENVRELLSTFTAYEYDAEDTADLSLNYLRPYHHVKIFNIGPNVEIARDIEFPAGMEVIHSHTSDEHSAAVYVIRRSIRPEWTTAQDFDTIDYHLIINYYDRESGLLFICSSLRVDGLYEHIGQEYASDDPNSRLRGPSVKRLNKILLDLRNPRFFNIGMRKAVLGDRSEAYRTIAGSKADDAIDQTVGHSFYRGHWFGSAISDGESVTIGLSSSAKLWSNQSTQIPGLIEWCQQLARKITSDRSPRTNSGLDLLSTGEDLAQIPRNIAWMDWHQDAYQTPVTARYTDGAGNPTTVQLLDLDLRVDYEHTDERQVTFIVSDAGVQYRAAFSLETDRFIHASEDNETEIILDEHAMPLDEYLNIYPPVVYTSDFASFQGGSYFPANEVDPQPFDLGRFEIVDWAAAAVDIELEFGEMTRRGQSIHEYLRNRLIASDASVVLYDHGPGEMADFVSLFLDQDQVRVSLYHCKASSGAVARQRLSDAYDVCGQAVKCVRWAKPPLILDSITRRLGRQRNPSRFEKGNMAALRQALDPTNRKQVLFESVIVQPGFSRANLGDRVGPLLAAADGFLFDCGRFTRLRVIGSQ
jgi:superfamily II DNA or RNA helicase